MSKKDKQKLEELTLEGSADFNLAQKVIGELSKNVASNVTVNKLILAVAIIEKSSLSKLSFRQIEAQLPPHGVIPKLKEELPEFLLAYSSWLKFRSFCRQGAFSSLVFAICGIYLCFVNYLPIELGGPLIILFAMLSVVFSSKLLQLRKLLHGI